jgi:hypothetical protein
MGIFRRRFADLGRSLIAHERAYGYYSRAFSVLIVAAAIAMAVIAAVMVQQSPYVDPACRDNPDTNKDNVQVTNIQLARGPEKIRNQLAGKMSLTSQGPPDAAICIAERAGQFQRQLSMDSALFIPAYLLLTGFTLCWLAAVSVHAKDATGRWLSPNSSFLATLLVSGAAVLLLAWLDASENRATIELLEFASGVGALADPISSELGKAVVSANDASLWKWLATSFWATTLAVSVWYQREVLTTALKPRNFWQRAVNALPMLFVVLALFAAVTMFVGSAGAMLVHPADTSTWVDVVQALIVTGFFVMMAGGLALMCLGIVFLKTSADLLHHSSQRIVQD